MTIPYIGISFAPEKKGGVVKTDLELFHKFIHYMPYLQPCDDDQRKWRQLDDLDEDNGQDHGGQVQVTGNMT